MSNKRALRFVNETKEERELRHFKYEMIFLTILTVCCIILTAGGTYSWFGGDGEESTASLPAVLYDKAPDTTLSTEETGENNTLCYSTVAVETVEVISETEELAVGGSFPVVDAFPAVPVDGDFKAHVIDVCGQYGIEPTIVFGMMYHESRYQSDVIGDDGESIGIMQIQPKWHRERMEELGADNLLDPYDNVTVAIDYLGDLMDRYDGDIGAALTAYNRGHYSGTVSRYAELVIEQAERIGEAG